MQRRVGSAVAIALTAAAVVVPPAPASAADGVAIVGLDRLHLGRWGGRGDLTAGDEHCIAVRRRHGPPRFNLVVAGDGPGGGFVLTDGATTLPFTVRYDDGRGGRSVEPGRTLDHVAGQPATSGPVLCRAGDRGARNRLEVRVRERDLARVPAGRFHGRLHLTILAE